MRPSTLPQDVAPDVGETCRRRASLEEARLQYFYDRETFGGAVVAGDVPEAERYTTEYHATQIDLVMGALGRLAHADVPPDEPLARPLDYALILGTMERPEFLIRNYWRDAVVAEQRLSGVNPLVLRAVSEELLKDLGERVVLTDAHLEHVGMPVSGQDPSSLQEAVAERCLFVCDYAQLDGLPRGMWSRGPKHLPAPIAFFVWRSTGQRARGELVPIAIQLSQAPGYVFRPGDRAWLRAKLLLQVADANHHEMASHLARTHLAMEPFVVATARQLADTHPVSRLLKPHFRFLLARNSEARLRLLKPDGPVDNLLASSLAGSIELAGRSLTAWKFRPCGFRADLEARGVWDSEVLPHYPYRDDGRLLFEAIGRFCDAYVRAYYPSNDHVARDSELEAWTRELVDPREGAGVKGLEARFLDTTALATCLQEILFTCGPLHAATNFPQFETMSFAPNMPLAAYHRPPLDAEGEGELEDEAYRKTLPPARQAALQALVTYTLSAYRHDQFGDYSETELATEPRLAGILAAFSRDLHAIERSIDRRNRRRLRPYPYLRPSLIPNSINV